MGHEIVRFHGLFFCTVIDDCMVAINDSATLFPAGS